MVRAPAKTNLFLRVTGRRADGYHTLETLMHKVGLFDLLELRRGGEGVHLHCPGADLPEDSGNLVHRAAELFLQTAAQRLGGPLPGVDIALFKNIPVAADPGGGSSDAAATLKGLNRLFDAGLDGRRTRGPRAAPGCGMYLFRGRCTGRAGRRHRRNPYPGRPADRLFRAAR